MKSNVPVITDEAAVPATLEQTARSEPPGAPQARPRQNVATGLLPLALGVLVLAFLALAFWTLMAATGSGP